MDASHLMEAFCNSFEQAPKNCDRLDGFEEYKAFSSFSIFKFVFMSLIITVIVAFLMIFVFYYVFKRKMKKNFNAELQSKINEAMSKYYSDKSGDYQGIKKSEQIE